MLANFPAASSSLLPPGSFECCSWGRWRYNNSAHIWKPKRQMMNLSFTKNFYFCSWYSKKVPPLKTSKSAFPIRFHIQPFKSLGLTWVSFALRSFLFFEVGVREEEVGFEVCLSPAPSSLVFLAFFPSHFVFWWLAFSEKQGASGNVCCYTDAWRKENFCRKLLKLLLK